MTETRRKTGRPCDWCDKALGSAYVTGDDGARYCSRECENARLALLGAAPALLAACRVCATTIIELLDAETPTSTDWLNVRVARNLALAAIAEAKP